MVGQAAFDVASKMIPATPVDVVEDRRERYFFYPGDEPGLPAPGGISVQSLSIPNKLIRRCEVTPCLTVQVPARMQEIPDGSRIRGTEEYSRGIAKYWLYSGSECSNLLEQYGNMLDAAHNWGLVELDVLRGMPVGEVAKLHVTETFFPEYPRIPETNADVMRQINAALDRIRVTDTPARTLLLAIGQKMLDAVEAAHRHMTDVIAATNIAVTLPSTEPGYKRNFDERDRLFSLRTGIPLAINSLREQVAEKVPAGIDPNTVATIVAATVAAINQNNAMQTAPAPAPQPPPSPTEPPVSSDVVVVDDVEVDEGISTTRTRRKR